MPKPTYRLFTVSSGVVEPSVIVGKWTPMGAARAVPVIIVGQQGPERMRDVLTVNLFGSLQHIWGEEGSVNIAAAALGQTQSGDNWKLFAGDKADTDEEIICLFRTKYGSRGRKAHTGDRCGWKCSSPHCFANGPGEMPEECPVCKMKDGSSAAPVWMFREFPGQILARGVCADSQEIIAKMPRGVIFCTHYTNSPYGAPDSHYYVWTGLELICATWDERVCRQTVLILLSQA